MAIAPLGADHAWLWDAAAGGRLDAVSNSDNEHHTDVNSYDMGAPFVAEQTQAGKPSTLHTRLRRGRVRSCELSDRLRYSRKGKLNSHSRLNRVKELYRLNIGLFPCGLEAVALEYCNSYGSAAMAYVRLTSEQEFRGALAYVRRQSRFNDLDQSDCELIERFFRAGITATALLDALDERRAACLPDQSRADGDGLPPFKSAS